MSGDNNSYEPITDWSREGRAALYSRHRWEIEKLLWDAWESFASDYDLSRFFGKCTGDENEIDRATAWCITRFVSGDLDPAMLTDRSFRLFTHPRFWIAQKVGAENLKAVLARSRIDYEQPSDGHDGSSVPPWDRPQAHGQMPVDCTPNSPSLGIDVQAFCDRLGDTLAVLHRRTCHCIVFYWLHGTEDLREILGWYLPVGIPPNTPGRSRKDQSFHSHDAMFRFVCLFAELVPEDSPPASLRVAVLAMFTSCPDKRPYRNEDSDIHARDPSLASSPRAVGKLRQEGCAELLDRALSLLERGPRLGEVLAVWFMRQSLSKTTVYALGLKERLDLRDRAAQVHERLFVEEN
jgi:hypothetical protein